MMTRIYNVYRSAACTLLLTAALAACTDSHEPMQENETPREGVFFSVTATQGEGAETRVDYTPNGDQGMDVTWASGDVIYVGKLTDGWLKNGNLSTLTLKPGDEGGTTARFEGTIADAHLPANGETLYAFYGKSIEISNGNIGYYYTGQRQTVNHDMTHISAYDFMIATTPYDATPGANHHFSFRHVGSLMKFTLDGLRGKTVKELRLTTYDTNNVFRYGDNTRASSVFLQLGAENSNGLSIGSFDTLEAYLMMRPNTEIAGQDLILYATTADGKKYSTLLKGAEIVAGKIYTVDATLTEFGFQGAGTESEPYQIKDAGDLTKLAVMTNMKWIDTEGKYFELTNDIDMATGGESWVPIGHGDVTRIYFKGTFLGNNHSISNLPSKRLYTSAGLFSHLDGATIKDLTVKGNIIVNAAHVTKLNVGGIAGIASNSTIENCVSECKIDVTRDGRRVGGIIGYSKGNNKVINCQNLDSVSSNDRSGGIIGYAENGGEITNCTNSGEITSTSTAYPAGGMIGYWEVTSSSRFTLTGCTHSGTAPEPNTAGSIIGGYKIPSSFATGSSITIKNDASDPGTTINGIAGQDVTGKWPEAN